MSKHKYPVGTTFEFGHAGDKVWGIYEITDLVTSLDHDVPHYQVKLVRDGVSVTGKLCGWANIWSVNDQQLRTDRSYFRNIQLPARSPLDEGDCV